MRFQSVFAVGLLVVTTLLSGCSDDAEDARGDDATTAPSTAGGTTETGSSNGGGAGGTGLAPAIDWSNIDDQSIAEIADANDVAPACIAAAVALNEVVGLMGGSTFPQRIVDEAKELFPAELSEDAASLRSLLGNLVGPDGLVDPSRAFALQASPEFNEVTGSIKGWVSDNCSNDAGS